MMTSSKAHADVHDAGAATILLVLRSLMMAAVVGGDVDVVPADAAGLVHPFPELLLCLGDRHGERVERTDREVGDAAEIDASMVLVDRVGARLLGDPDIGAWARGGATGTGAASAAGGTGQHEQRDEGERSQPPH